MIVGIFGKIASGKSTLALKKQQEEPGKRWQILDLDEIGHELLKRPDIRGKVFRAFPAENILTNGEIDRKKLGEMAFSDQKKLAILEEILHPRIQEQMESVLKRSKETGANLLLLSALPQKMELEQYCDEVVVLSVSKGEAWKRTKKDRELPQDVFESIWNSQSTISISL